VKIVLGLARTGLIFTGIQEGTQLGWLTQTCQEEQGIRYCVPSCRILGQGELAKGKAVTALGVHGELCSESCSEHFTVFFVYSPSLYCCSCSLNLLFC